MPRSIALLLAAACTATLVAQDQQKPTFSTAVRTVPVYATVTDKGGRLVPNLTRDDFEVLDDGAPQTLSVFVNEVTPFKAVIMLDTSGSMTMNLELLKAAAEQFVLRMLPDDRARIGSFSDKIEISPTFTGDRDALIHILRNDIDFGNPTRLWDAIDESMTALSGEDGRRVVVVFTDGYDEFSEHTSYKDVVKRAQTENFMVYAIGLESVLPQGRTKPDPGLKKLAGETGGGYFELKQTAELNSTFTRVVEELHSQYVLGFTPTTLDGKLHKIDVRVKQPGMTARARKTYLASPGK